MQEDQSYLATEYKTSDNQDTRIGFYERFSTNPQGWQRWVWDHLRLPEQARILELGCGPGTLWLDNRERIPPGWDVTLSDFSPGMLAAARENLQQCDHPFTFEVIDIRDTSSGGGPFDAVIANHMLFHLEDCAAPLQRIHRMLRPGGRFFAATLGRSHLQELRSLVMRFVSVPPAPDFILETGASELAHWFDPVTLHRFDNALVVPEASPMADYVLSHDQLQPEDQEAFRRCLEEAIANHGPMRLTIDAGLFDAVRR